MGGITTYVYAIVADIDAHHARAQAAGTTIITLPHDNDGYPGPGYDAYDPEGNLWCFGGHDPFDLPRDI